MKPETRWTAKTLLGVSLWAWVLALFCISATQVTAQDRDEPLWTSHSITHFGGPGLIEMPSGYAMDDGDLVISSMISDQTWRLTLYFQFTDRISGVFRYVFLEDYLPSGDFYDRGFDVRYLLAEEGAYTPAVTIGLQDFGGTGIFASEYIAASKSFGNLRATAGLGWGRFASLNGITNPIDGLANRPTGITTIEQTGRLDTEQWFRGDIGLFGGLEYDATDRLRFTLEYSSDDKTEEQARLGYGYETPINVGFTYALRDGLTLQGALVNGTTATLQLAYIFNPKSPTMAAPARGPGPLPVLARAPATASDLGWTAQPNAPQMLADRIAEQLSPEGVTVESFKTGATRAELRIRNDTMNTAQAIGRTAGILTRTLPASIETIELVPVTANGQPISRLVLSRSDLEELVHAPDGAWQSFARTRFDDSYDTDTLGVSVDLIGTEATGNRERFTWGLGPYLEASYFDPDSPVRLDVGLRARARWEPVSGLIFSGEYRERLGGNRAEMRRSNSVIQRVRTDAGIYAEEGGSSLRRLTGAYYFRPGPDLYGRVTAGYLERMYAGLSAEVLWKPVTSRLGVGTEINYAVQRDFDQGFGLQDYRTVTGHMSFYYKTDGDYHYQLDLGRYLAEDWGGTLRIDREFDNGIRFGVFATLTDVPFDEFGEGSFDKGFRFTIPLSALTGDRRTSKISRTIRPVTRDGGARLDVPGRLYESVRTWQQPALQDQWGRFWR